MKYNYYCSSKECTLTDYKNSNVDNLIIKIAQVETIDNELLIWEVSHGMMESPEIKCPVCGGHAIKYLGFNTGSFFIRGNGLLDKAGCRREMALHHLDGKDSDGNPLNPYEEHYESGEKDYIRGFIKRKGKQAPLVPIDKEIKIINRLDNYINKVAKFINKTNTEIEVY